MRGLLLSLAVVVFFGTAPLNAQPTQQLKVTILVPETPVTGHSDEVFVMLTTEYPPGATTGRHVHPGDEYSTLVEGTVMTWREGGEWRTVNAGEPFSVPANIVHETKNVGTGAAKAVNAFVLEKGKPRVTPAP